MKRTDLVAGRDYGHTDSPRYARATRVTVLTTEPLVRVELPPYVRDRTAHMEDITLPDGTTIKALARAPRPRDTTASKGVLVRRQDGRMFVSSLTSLRGEWSAVVKEQQQRDATNHAAREAQAAVQREATSRLRAAESAAATILKRAVTIRENAGGWTLNPEDLEALLNR